MKEMRRWLAMLLCVVMLVGVMPVNALANEEAIISEISETAEIGVSDGISGNALSEDDDPAEGNENVPSEDEDATDPSEDEDATDPSEDEDATDPSEGEDATDPSEGEDATDPSEGEDATDPSEGEDATDPSEDEDATDPSEDVEDSEEEDSAVAVTGITLDVTALEVCVGAEPVTLTATVTPEDATDKTVTWTSSNEDVAFFDEDGLLNFGMIGEADITATAGGFSDTCHVTVFLDEDEITGYADPNTTYVLAGSDFQASSHNAGATLVSGLLDQIDNVYSRMDGFLFAGDYDSDYDDSANGKAKLQETVQAVYGNAMHEVYVQGNHDVDNLVGGTLAASGNNDPSSGKYGVFVINEKDYMWYNDNKSTIEATANNLASYLDAKRNTGYAKPIFVVSHLPLHYCMRTQQDGDGMYANYLFDVMNEAGAAGLNIIFLFGHNHSHGWDDPYGGAAIFLTRGDKINIAQGSKTEYKEETLNFTYMNAGYVTYYRNVNSGSETDLTMTVFAITDNNVTIERYSNSGLHALKSVGVENAHAESTSYVSDGGGSYCRHGLTENYLPNTSVVSSPYTLTLTAPKTVNTLTENGVSVTALGLTGLTVAKLDVETPAGYTAYASYDITPAGYTQGEEATVTISVPDDFDAAKKVMVLDGDNVIARVAIENGEITFTTNHFSVYDIAQQDVTEETAEGNLAGNAYTQQIMNKSELETGVGYLIVPNSGTAVTLTNQTSSGRLKLSGGVNADNTNLWYWDGNDHLLYGSPTPNNNYLNITYTGNWFSSTSTASLGSNGNNAVNKITQDSNGVFYISVGTSTVGTSTYLNRNGGANGATAGGYDDDDANSGWKIYKVVNENGSAVTLTVNPGSVSLMPGNTAALTPTVLVDGAAASSYTLTYSSSAANVATVSDTGVITGEADGSAIITVTLTEANGKNANGTISVEIPVIVVSKAIDHLTVAPAMGDVIVGSDSTAPTGSLLTVHYADGTTENVPVTLAMLGNPDVSRVTTHENLTISYGGKTLGGYTLAVVSAAINNYPEYPNQGSVRVNKTGTGIDFQASGLAQVEVSATGLPAGKGVDVVVVIDTSSSMVDNKIDTKTRIQVLSESLKNMLEDFQKADTVTGIVPDVDIAIIDFNGYGTSSNTYNYISGASLNNSYRSNVDYAKVYTGPNAGSTIRTISGGLTANNFVKSTTINPTAMAGQFTASVCESGTNYDGALHNTYKLLAAKKAANDAAGVERDQFVIFLSDGAPYRYNGFSNEYQGYKNWNMWLSGDWSTIEEVNAVSSNDTYTYFYNGNGTNHPHRVAEAIKGTGSYTVVTAGNTQPYTYELAGLNTKIYAIGFGLADDTQSYYGGTVTTTTQQELIETISSGVGYSYPNVQTADALDEAFKRITAEISFAATNARFVDQMGDDYNLQIKTHEYASTGSQVKDKMVEPKIEIINYDIYTKGETIPTGKKVGDRKGTSTTLETVIFNVTGTEAYSDQPSIGPNGETIPAGQNILINGVIYAKSFWYNTTSAPVAINGVSIPTGTNSNGTTYGSRDLLPAETFYWKMGTINTSELAMRYYVYLDGSLEGTRDPGSYPTNEYATLYYDNYLDNPCYKETVSPVLAWAGANVSYAFYLVNENGEIVVNQNTGETGTFANKIAVTNPVVYKSVRLNTQQQINSLEVASLDVLPEGYKLYDSQAKYTVQVNSNATGSWSIVSSSGKEQSSYVTQFDPKDASAYSNDLTKNSGADFTHTVVWFAVLWEIQALPDTVVIDYGLPVDISVLTNDMFGSNGRLAGVGTVEAAQAATSADLTGHTAALASGFSNNHAGTYGTAEINTETGKVRYTLNTANGMQMETYEQFAYAARYTGSKNAGFYYDTVTVIPATTIYYEDSFVQFDNLNWQQGESGNSWDGEWVVDATANGSRWTPEGNADTGATQAEDRPGAYSLTDANNIYGFDAVNNNLSTYSLGSAMKTTVRMNEAAQASFTFVGTGFDVISMTDATTGTILVDVYPVNADGTLGDAVRNNVVDTYYGYKQAECHVVYTFRNNKWVRSNVLHESSACNLNCHLSESLPETAEENAKVFLSENAWIVDPTSKDAIWQVPVMKVEGLTYGTYRAEIRAVYDAGFDHAGDAANYDFYLDAIRIYDPANDGAGNQVIQDAYVADSEGWPSYIELRNKLIDKNTLGNAQTDTKINGLVFIDGDDEIGDAQIRDYISYGPNNEVYLDADQSVAFLLETPENIARVHLGIKSANGEAVTYKISNIAKSDIVSDQGTVSKGTVFNEKEGSVNTTTDMYYDITGWRNNIIVIKNSGSSGIISLTNIKSTYTSNPNGAVTTGEENTENGIAPASELGDEGVIPANETYLYMTPAAATLTLRSLNAPTQGGEEEPDATEPEVTVPETTEPEPTVPETTEPEETVPEETKPGTGNNPIGTIVQTVVKTVTKVVKHVLENIFGGWFR